MAYLLISASIAALSAVNTADIFDHYAGWIDKINGEVYPQYSSDINLQYMTLRQPVGVVGAIIPWNAPLMMWAMKVAPALATGCTIVMKPSELASLSVIRLTELLQEIDLPEGVFNLVTGGAEVGSSLVTHPGVDKVTFTGSPVVGESILGSSGSNMKRVTLELGGKSAAIVFFRCSFSGCSRANGHGAMFYLPVQARFVRPIHEHWYMSRSTISLLMLPKRKLRRLNRVTPSIWIPRHLQSLANGRSSA